MRSLRSRTATRLGAFGARLRPGLPPYQTPWTPKTLKTPKTPWTRLFIHHNPE